MVSITQDEAFNFITLGVERFSLHIEIDSFTKLQLYGTGKITEGVELFGIGPMELIRGAGFLAEYRELVNYAISKHYRVFVLMEGLVASDENWYLEFRKSELD